MSTSTTFWVGLEECPKMIDFWVGQKSPSWCLRAVYEAPTLIDKNPGGCPGGGLPNMTFLVIN